MDSVIDWITEQEWAARIALIVVLALIAQYLASRAIGSFTRSLVERSGEGRGVVERSARRLGIASEPEKRTRQRAQTLESVFRGAVRVLIFTIALLMILSEIGINLAPLIAGAGIAGVAIGFGAQSLVKDVVAGAFFLIEDQFGVGDIIDVGEAFGTVEAMSLRTTRVRDIDGVLWIVPNGEIERVGNTSQQWSQATLDLDVAYDTDIDRAMAVIDDVLRAAKEDPALPILDTPTVLGVESFGPDAITIRSTVRTEPGEQYAVARAVRARIKQAFDDQDIEIPFPQRTVWVRNDAGRGPLESVDDTGDGPAGPAAV